MVRNSTKSDMLSVGSLLHQCLGTIFEFRSEKTRQPYLETHPMIAMHANHLSKPDGKSNLAAFSVGATTTLKKVENWKLKPVNQGFLEAQ
jgi:hypothetical protein